MFNAAISFLTPTNSRCRAALAVATWIAIAVFAMIVVSMLGGCQASLGVGNAPSPLPPPLVTTGTMIAADAGTIALIQNAKPAERAELASVINQVADAMTAAASVPPDFTKLDAVINGRLATWKSPYAPIVMAMAQQILADVQAQAATQAQTSQGAAAASLIRAAAAGMKMGAMVGGAPPQ